MHPLPAGPFGQFALANSTPAPWYLLPFDKEGNTTGPQTYRHFVDAARSGNFTDIHIFSHGWNNVFDEATDLYREFWSGYFKIRDELNINTGYRPLIAGIIWPSTAMVGSDEGTPAMAATDPGIAPELEQLAADLTPEAAARLQQLAGEPELDDQQALELAGILLPIYNRPEPDAFTQSEPDDPVSAGELVEVWREAAAKPKFADTSGEIRPLDDAPDLTGGPQAAGLFDLLDPKNIVRLATVYQMKDRAGTVGARGVNKLLDEILTGTGTRVHLLGHSYGCRVMLSAVSIKPLPRKLRSMTLLQPAVNYLCFSSNADGQGRAGGYRPALDRVELPIVHTFSERDFPLNKTFHLSVRRDRDLGEAIIAAPGLAPSRFAALGGYGPGGLDHKEFDMTEIPARPAKFPQLGPGVRVLALDGSNGRINGHGDIRNKFTQWAHLNLVSPDRL